MKDDSRWCPSWLPVFANGGGDFYAINLSLGRDRGTIVGFLLGESEHPIEYQSVKAMFATLLACYQEGIFALNPEGYLDMDDAQHALVAQRFNCAYRLFILCGLSEVFVMQSATMLARANISLTWELNEPPLR